MEWKPLPIGVESFEELIEKGYYFVDKTLFIRDLLNMKGKVNLFTRPRRFGKTLNMSMLRYFFEMGEDNKELFAGTKIMSAGEKYRNAMGQFPVVSLSLKSMKQPSYELSFEMLKKAVREEYARHWKTVEAGGRLDGADQERYQRIWDLKGTDADYADALKYLSECLYTATGRKTIILIDEYDVPLENAFFSGFYDRMTALIRSLFESALKTNENLEFAVVTGCLRISRESIFTGLNNLKIMSVTAANYAEYFGFTPDEVEAMLRDYGRTRWKRCCGITVWRKIWRRCGGGTTATSSGMRRFTIPGASSITWIPAEQTKRRSQSPTGPIPAPTASSVPWWRGRICPSSRRSRA